MQKKILVSAYHHSVCNIRSTFTIFILLVVTLTSMLSYFRKIQAFSAPNFAVNPNLKYFGYFNDYDDGSKSIPNGFAELGNLNNSNIVHFNLSSTSVADNQYFLNKAKLSNLKILPGIETIFGKYYGDTTTNYTNQDFENSFSYLEDSLQGYEDQILALYVQDEPNFDGIRESKFVDLTLRLKNRFPNYRRLITYAYPQLIDTGIPGWLPATSSLISNITDVGFDGYKFTGFPTNNAGRQPYLTALANLANQGQNLWLVPDAVDAQPRSNCTAVSGAPDKVYLTNAMEDYYQLALNNSRVVGMYSFLWDVREIPGLDWIDTRRIFDSSDPCYSPTMKQKHTDIGRSIITNVDIVAPTKPIIVTNTGTPQSYSSSGTAEPNSTVKVYDDQGNIYCNATANAIGNWSCNISNPTSAKLKIFAVDASGNWSQPSPFIFNTNLKYFGYFNLQSSDNSVADSLSELKLLDNSNIVYWTLSGNISQNRYFLEKAKAANQKVILGAFVPFYEWATNYPGFESLPDSWVDARIEEMKPNFVGYEDVVDSLYFDEPVFNRYDEAKFVRLTAKLKQNFPDFRIALAEAFPSVILDTINPDPLFNSAPQITSSWLVNVDDVGYDGYLYTYSKSNSPLFKPKIQDYLNRLINISTNNQRLWLYPDAFAYDCTDGGNYLVNAIDDYYEVAQKNPRVVGLMNFAWKVNSADLDIQKLFNPSNSCYNPTLKSNHITKGKSIIANTDIIAPTKPTTTTKTANTFSGSAEANSRIKGYDPAGNIVCDVVVSSSGAWTCPYPNTGQLVRFFAVDAAGNWSQPESFNPNLQYFGYYNGASFATNDNLPEIQQLGNSNLVLYQFEYESLENIKSTLNKARIANQKVIVSFAGPYINYLKGQENLTEKQFTDSMNFYERGFEGNEDLIYALYIDEPVGNLYDINRFLDLTARWKVKFPNYRRMTIETGPALEGYIGRNPYNSPKTLAAYYANITDLGIDDYAYTPNSADKTVPYTNKQIVNDNINKLLLLSNPSQKIWIVPDSFLYNNCNSGTSYLDNAITDYYDVAKNNPRINGLMVFAYDVRPFVGIVDLRQLINPTDPCYSPNLKQKYLDVGKPIIANMDIIAPPKPTISSIIGGPTNFVVIGSGEPRSNTKIYDDLGNILCDVVVDILGNYSCSINIVANSNGKFKIYSTDKSGNNSQLVRFNIGGNCEYKALPTINSNDWGNSLNSLLCQSIIVDTNSLDLGKLRSDLSSITDTCRIGIGTNNPSTPFAVVGLSEYPSETVAISAGLKNGDFYRTGTQVRVVIGGSSIVEKPIVIDSDCSPSSPNRLPIIDSDGGEWGNIFNHFICNTRFNNETSLDSGKLKNDLASITAGRKVGVGTVPSSSTNFAIKGLPNILNVPFAGTGLTYNQNAEVNNLKNGDIYQTNGFLQVVNTSNFSNISSVNSDDCYQSVAETRLPRPGQDVGTWGSLLNNFICKTILNGPTNIGKLKTDLGSMVQGGKIGIGTNNPISILAVPNLPEFLDNASAINAGLKEGDIYRTVGDVKVVY